MEITSRYTYLMLINLGEALTEAGNACQRGGVPGPDFANVRLALRRALFASEGLIYEPPISLEEIRRAEISRLTTQSNECDTAPIGDQDGRRDEAGVRGDAEGDQRA